MMPLVDPRRPASHAEPEASRTLLTHRVAKIAHCDITRPKPVDVNKIHLKKPVKDHSQQQQQQLLLQELDKQLVTKVNRSEDPRPSKKEEVKEDNSLRALILRNTIGSIKTTIGSFAHQGVSNRNSAAASGNKGGGEVWDSQRLEEESEIALERRRQQLTQELMREIAGDSLHHRSNMDKKGSSNWDDYNRDMREVLEPQRKESQMGARKRKREDRRVHGQHGYRRSMTSSSSSSSSSTSSSTSSSSSSSSSDSSPHRSGHKRDAKRKPRASGKRMPSTSDRSKMKKMKSSSSSRKHSSTKLMKKGHPSKKDHEKLRVHKSSHSPTRRKSSISKRLMSPGRKRSSSPGSRKSHKISPGLAKHSKSRKRSGSPRERLDYRGGDRMGPPERSLSHGRDPSMVGRAGSSSHNRDPRVDERMRRISPEQIPRDRYRPDSPTRRYDKERIDEFIEARRDRRSPVSRSREVERKDPHRHREYERHERDHYDERRREDPRREEREREQRERELRELREREILKERERVELMEQERERERLREEERRGRYGREHEFPREREVVVRGASRDFEGDRDYYSRNRPEIDPRAIAVDERHPYEDPEYDRFAGERERSRYESGRGRYDEIALHDRRAIPPLDERRPDRRGQPLDARFQEDRRRSSGSLDPRVHEPWLEEHRGIERLDRPDHFPAHGPPSRHRHQPEWTGGRQGAAWDRHKHPRHEEWGEEYGRGGRDWAEDPHDWVPEIGGPPPVHQEQWSQNPRRGYRDDWGGRGGGGEWVDRTPAYPPTRDLGPPPALGRSEHSQPPPINRRPRREPVEPPLEPPPPSNVQQRLHPPPSGDDESNESALVPPRGGDVVTPPPQEQDQALMPGNDGELWEYDPGKGSWVRRAADAGPPSEGDSPIKKEKPQPPISLEPPSEAMLQSTKPPPEPEAAMEEEKKRGVSEENSLDGSAPKRQQSETPAATPGDADASLQEKDTFSDISDDADDILNQEVGGFNDEDSRNLSSSQMEDSRNLSRENGPSYDELMEEEEAIHLEEISDDEFEDDRQAKFSVADALDINWASLVIDSRQPANEVAAGTALKRFSPAHLLARLGVSSRYARPEVIQRVKEACSASVAEDDEESAKLEVPAVTDKAGVLRLIKARAEGRQRILQSIGPNRRALCARQDLALRRQLCNLPEQDYIGENPLLDKDLFRQSVNLLKSC